YGPSRAGFFGRNFVLLGRADHQRFTDLLGFSTDRIFDPLRDVEILLEIELGVLAALSDPDRIIAEPGARFLDQPRLYTQVKDLADLRHAFTVHDVEFDLLERRSD